MEKYLQLAREKGADLAVVIDAKSVVTAAWTVYRCRYGCDTYGKSHCCPPKTPTWKETREMLDCFQRGILFRCHDMSVATPLAVELARVLFLDGYYKTIAFGSGPCKRCKECDPERCNFPAETVPSMEACGIDVFATVRANGIDLQTLKEKGETQNYFGLVLVD